MLGISYGELFLLLGATAALVGTKDLPVIARTAGRFAGRAIGYVQMARGQFESVHKELQDTMAQLEAIRHEIRSISFVNPGPLTRRLVDNLDQISTGNVENAPERDIKETKATATNSKAHSTAIPVMHSQLIANTDLADSMTLKDQSTMSTSSDLNGRATAYARLAESTFLNSGPGNSDILRELVDESGHVIILPVSAETAELLPKREADVKGADIVLEAVLEAEIARNAKEFFSQPQNLKPE
ncbi:hypothetical protein Leryth_010570 [Lithospermum erythrorhizon]|nr:hypothetical protein Leryth_010570 [Lithospermum erythrorhizon]